MRNVTDSQDSPPQLCVATKFGCEFGAQSTAAGIPGARVMKFAAFHAGYSRGISGTGKMALSRGLAVTGGQAAGGD
jgi:hypothetical protein